jgi:beta-ketodecanoyl-[acyl-carrier-protein] synthase
MSYMTHKPTAELRKIFADLDEVIDAAKRSQEEISQLLLLRHSKRFQDELATAGKQGSDIDGVLCAAANMQRAYPAMACEIQAALGCGGYGFYMNVA